MSYNNINANNVNGTLSSNDAGGVAFGMPSCDQQQAGREQTTGPAHVNDQACAASGVATGSGSQSKAFGSEQRKRIPRTPSERYHRSLFGGERRPFTRYYTIQSTGDADLRKLNLFKVDKEICERIGKPQKITEEESKKNIVVEVKSPEQGENLMKMNILVGEPVMVIPHERHNESQGVITCGLLKNYSEDDIVEGLAHLGVTKVYKIKKKIAEGKLETTSTLVLTFNKPSIPDRICIRTGLTERVRQYIPLPKRCFKCQGYGHITKYCRSKRDICGRCSNECDDNHKSESCSMPIRCFHCEEAHLTANKKCPKYLMEKEILAVKTKEHLSFREAKAIVANMYISPGVTYSSVVQSKKRTIPSNTSPSVSELEKTIASQSAMEESPSSSVETPCRHDEDNPNDNNRGHKRRSSSPIKTVENQSKKSNNNEASSIEWKNAKKTPQKQVSSDVLDWSLDDSNQFQLLGSLQNIAEAYKLAYPNMEHSSQESVINQEPTTSSKSSIPVLVNKTTQANNENRKTYQSQPKKEDYTRSRQRHNSKDQKKSAHLSDRRSRDKPRSNQ